MLYHEKFESSYLIVHESINVDNLREYNELRFGEYKLLYSDDLSVHDIREGEHRIIKVGYCLDIRAGAFSDEDNIRTLIHSDDLVEELEYINGRYFIISIKEEGIKIYSDASQLQPLVFNAMTKTLSSHDLLLSYVLEDNGKKLTRRPLEVHNEYDFTRFEEIQKFNPSLALELKSFSFERIYPRKELVEVSAKETFNQMKEYLDQMILWLSKQKKERFLSITSGIDSRVSAALTNSLKNEIEYFTYFVPSNYIPSKTARLIYNIDEDVTRSMKNNLNWNHSIVELTDFKIPKDELNQFKRFYNSKHGYRLIKYYRYQKKYYKALHIKSTVFGLGKADFSRKLDKHEDTLEFYQKCIHGLGEDFTKYYDIHDETKNYFNRNLIEEGVTKGRHFYDLYHLDSRMGNWHSSLTLETDPETDEFIFMNARKLIDYIQQPSISERRNFELYKMIINDYWPVLLHFGINSKKNLYERSMENDSIKRLNGVRVSKNKMQITDRSESVMEIKPETVKIDANDIFNLSLENMDKDTKRIEIKSLYRNEAGRGKIKVIIRNGNKNIDYDILDLNEGIDINLSKEVLSVIIMYDRSYSNATWPKAGTLLISIK